jgi:hypothetical protein
MLSIRSGWNESKLRWSNKERVKNFFYDAVLKCNSAFDILYLPSRAEPPCAGVVGFLSQNRGEIGWIFVTHCYS